MLAADRGARILPGMSRTPPAVHRRDTTTTVARDSAPAPLCNPTRKWNGIIVAVPLTDDPAQVTCPNCTRVTAQNLRREEGRPMTGPAGRIRVHYAQDHQADALALCRPDTPGLRITRDQAKVTCRQCTASLMTRRAAQDPQEVQSRGR